MTETPVPRRTTVRINLLVLRLARNWLKVVTIVLAVYVTLTLVEPTLMILVVL
jgi:hypothetical protein